MNDINNELVAQIKYIIELETRKFLIDIARFNKIVLNDYDEKIKQFEEELEAKISIYGKNKEKFENKRQEIIKSYKDEFDRVYKKRKTQLRGIQAEIQEIQANQKIAIANFKKFEEYRIVYLKSNEYRDFIEKKEQLQYMLEHAVTIEEANNYQQVLNKMQNPIDNFEGKMSALVEKYNEYDILVDACEKKIDECIEATLDDFNKISLKHETHMIDLKKQNKVFYYISKIISFIGGARSLEKHVINKYKNAILELSKINDKCIKTIDKQTLDLVCNINNIREDINEEFMKNAG